MCIIYRSIPSDSSFTDRNALDGQAFSEVGFGRVVPILLGLLLSRRRDREHLRRAARQYDWGMYASFGAIDGNTFGALLGLVEDQISDRKSASPRRPIALSPLWGGPPATVHDGIARIRAATVRQISFTLTGYDETALCVAYERDGDCIPAHFNQESALECVAQLREFFVGAASSEYDVIVSWEYR